MVDELDAFWQTVGIADADQIENLVARRALRRVTWITSCDGGSCSLRETLTDRSGRLAIIVRTEMVYGLSPSLSRRMMVQASIDSLLALEGVTLRSAEEIAKAA